MSMKKKCHILMVQFSRNSSVPGWLVCWMLKILLEFKSKILVFMYGPMISWFGDMLQAKCNKFKKYYKPNQTNTTKKNFILNSGWNYTEFYFGTIIHFNYLFLYWSLEFGFSTKEKTIPFGSKFKEMKIVIIISYWNEMQRNE